MMTRMINIFNINGLPSMTSLECQAYLKEIGQQWTGNGYAMELGSWLGASSIALLEGLVEAGYDRAYWAFDRWKAHISQVRKAKYVGFYLDEGMDTLPLFKKHVSPTYSYLNCVSGIMPLTLDKYTGGPIEICVFDAPKADPVFRSCIRALHKKWIPGITVVAFLDYWFFELGHEGKKKEQFMAAHNFVEKNKQCFTLLKEFRAESPAFFRYEEPLINI